MKVLRTIAELREDRKRRETVALVPTMGAFHEGHLELMRRARTLCSCVYVSLFVNPTQFGPGEDFEAYPRDEERDLALATGLSIDGVFMPSVDEMYPAEPVMVKVGGIADAWEGKHRPGHFDGVATVLTKLFNIVQPDVAVFGLKDLQQCAIVRTLVNGLRMPVELELVETVREPSGLAMSSRNAYFDDAQRVEASALYATLAQCATDFPARGKDAIECASAALAERGFEVEYLAVVEPQWLQESDDTSLGLRAIVAARFHGVRLIDNVPVPDR